MTRRIRVLHVVGNLDLGGSQKLTTLVATGLDRDRFEVAVLNLGSPGVYGERLRREGIAVTDLGIPLRPSPTSWLATAKGLRRLRQVLFARPRWDIVHTHLFRTSLLVAMPARLAGSRLFGTVHRIYFRWQPPVERLLAPLHEAIVVDSFAAKSILQARTRIPRDKYVVIHDGIDVAEFEAIPSRSDARRRLDLPEDALVTTEVAHLVPHKGQRHLLAAFKRIEGHDLRLVLVGDGPDREALGRLAEELGLTARVSILGARLDLATILAATDILALPSEHEGFGIVQAEAMYVGLPVVAGDRGGSVEVVVDGSTGYLVPFGDVDALADRLERLIASPALRIEFGEAGRARAIAEFTQEAMARRYAELYGGRQRRPG